MRKLFVIATMFALAACGKNNGNEKADGGDSIDPTDIVQQPTFAPPGGIYTTAQTVTISCSTPGSTIYYTTDGSAPTTASTRYTAPISVTSYRVLKAIATAPRSTASDVSSASYAFDTQAPSTEAPTFSPAGGSYASSQSVTVSSTTSGASIYYTTDGSNPTTASTRYTGPIAVAQSQTLRAFATGTGRSPSAAVSASYVIGGTVSYTAACAAFEAASVALYASCFHANPLDIQGDDTSSCAAVQKEIDKGLISYDATKGAACIAALGTLPCDFIFGLASAPAACAAMLSGKVATNGSCYSSVDCQAGFCTSEVTTTCPGTCKPFGADGASCADDAPCGSGFECFTGACKARSAAGGACPCKVGLWCDLDLSTNSGTCKARLAAGASCNAHGSDTCAIGLICAADTATCKALAGEGDTCVPPTQSGGPTVCGRGYHCDSSTKKCVSDPTAGHACSADVNCLMGYCDDVTTPSAPVCKALVSDGGNCTDPLQCASLSCTNGKCDASTSGVCVSP